MYQKETTVTNETGLHARPASQFVQLAKKFESDITITNLKTSKSADAKSIIKVLILSLIKGTPLRIEAEGKDETKAVDSLIHLIDSDFGDLED